MNTSCTLWLCASTVSDDMSAFAQSMMVWGWTAALSVVLALSGVIWRGLTRRIDEVKDCVRRSVTATECSARCEALGDRLALTVKPIEDKIDSLKNGGSYDQLAEKIEGHTAAITRLETMLEQHTKTAKTKAR